MPLYEFLPKEGKSVAQILQLSSTDCGQTFYQSFSTIKGLQYLSRNEFGEPEF